MSLTNAPETVPRDAMHLLNFSSVHSAQWVAVREGAVAVNVPDDGVSVPDYGVSVAGDGVSVPGAT